MARTEIPIPEDDPAIWLEARLMADGLSFQRLALKKYSGSIHWHIRQVGSTGTLEATWWPSRNEFWFDQRAGRVADWQTVVIASLLQAPEASP